MFADQNSTTQTRRDKKILFVPFGVSCGHQMKEPRMTRMSRIKKNVLSETNKDVWLGHSLARKED